MKNYKLYGAILGDLAGQPYEFPPMKGPYNNVDLHNPKAHITDDTIMTLASADHIMYGERDKLSISQYYKWWGNMYPEAGYGKGLM
jgi:ADP-ribosylglycohydrolase